FLSRGLYSPARLSDLRSQSVETPSAAAALVIVPCDRKTAPRSTSAGDSFGPYTRGVYSPASLRAFVRQLRETPSCAAAFLNEPPCAYKLAPRSRSAGNSFGGRGGFCGFGGRRGFGGFGGGTGFGGLGGFGCGTGFGGFG